LQWNDQLWCTFQNPSLHIDILQFLQMQQPCSKYVTLRFMQT
jgi:hypothetical protein